MPDLVRTVSSKAGGRSAPRSMAAEAAPAREGNRLLAGLGEHADRFESVALTPGTPLVSAGEELRYCHFIESGLVSVVNSTGGERAAADGRAEVCVVGRDGMLGVPAVYGVTRVRYDAFALTTCRCRRIPTATFTDLLAADAAFRRLMLRYAYARMAEAMQVAACHSSHTLRGRLARWLLLADERLNGAGPDGTGEALEITHATLAALFSVRRAGITQSLHVLEGEGAVRSTRRRLELRDRSMLAALSCGCEAAVQKEYQQVMTG